MLECLHRVVDAVERCDGRIAAAASLAVLELGIRRLDVRGVRQHDAAELARRFRRVDGAREAFFDELRQQAAVVDMGVRQEDAFDVGGREWKVLIVELAHALRALEHAAVDEVVLLVRFEQVAGTCDGVGRTDEFESHEYHSFANFVLCL